MSKHPVVVQKLVQAAVSLGQAHAFGRALRFLGRGTQDADDIDAQPLERFYVHRADKTGANYCRTHLVHDVPPL
jgi:hypothetical protein